MPYSKDSDAPLMKTPSKKPPSASTGANASPTNSSKFRPPPPKTKFPLPVSSPSIKTEEESTKRKLNPYLCAVCQGPQNRNQQHKPERFIRCSICRRRGTIPPLHTPKPRTLSQNTRISLQLIHPASTCRRRCSSVPRNTRGNVSSANPAKSATADKM